MPESIQVRQSRSVAVFEENRTAVPRLAAISSSLGSVRSSRLHPRKHHFFQSVLAQDSMQSTSPVILSRFGLYRISITGTLVVRSM